MNRHHRRALAARIRLGRASEEDQKQAKGLTEAFGERWHTTGFKEIVRALMALK